MDLQWHYLVCMVEGPMAYTSCGEIREGICQEAEEFKKAQAASESAEESSGKKPSSTQVLRMLGVPCQSTAF